MLRQQCQSQGRSCEGLRRKQLASTRACRLLHIQFRVEKTGCERCIAPLEVLDSSQRRAYPSFTLPPWISVHFTHIEELCVLELDVDGESACCAIGPLFEVFFKNLDQPFLRSTGRWSQLLKTAKSFLSPEQRPQPSTSSFSRAALQKSTRLQADLSLRMGKKRVIQPTSVSLPSSKYAPGRKMLIWLAAGL